MRLPDLTFRLEDTVPLGEVQPMLSVLYAKSCSKGDDLGAVMRGMEAEIEKWCDQNMLMRGVYAFGHVEDVRGHDIRRVTVNVGILGRN